jgi:eukaryotic-like serine/threonine-protein kinase
VLARFQREARAASALTHPNICTIYDVGEVGGNAFIAMEYLEWHDAAVLPERPVDLERLIDVSIDLATGLESAAKRL